MERIMKMSERDRVRRREKGTLNRKNDFSSTFPLIFFCGESEVHDCIYNSILGTNLWFQDEKRVANEMVFRTGRKKEGCSVTEFVDREEEK